MMDGHGMWSLNRHACQRKMKETLDPSCGCGDDEASHWFENGENLFPAHRHIWRHLKRVSRVPGPGSHCMFGKLQSPYEDSNGISLMADIDSALRALEAGPPTFSA